MLNFNKRKYLYIWWKAKVNPFIKGLFIATSGIIIFFGVLFLLLDTIYGLFSIVMYLNGYHERFVTIGFYNGLIYIGICICFVLKFVFKNIIQKIYLVIKKNCYEVKLIKNLPITKEEYKNIGCETAEDIAMYLQLYRVYFINGRKYKMYYPDYICQSIFASIRRFPSNVKSEDKKANSTLYYMKTFVNDNFTNNDYLILKPYISPELQSIYELQSKHKLEKTKEVN
ncbi:hypothetical protein [Hungatella hathewayi]|uniref:hypothetical protein n=1 Tax=Hungatella hathewayi TaxID=154046 RepID=UPI0035632C04